MGRVLGMVCCGFGVVMMMGSGDLWGLDRYPLKMSTRRRAR